MITYVVLLRGIAPMNPQMRNDKLRSVVETLGFERVRTVISSGNVIFESPRRDVRAMEREIEQAWQSQLGFSSTTIIRSQRQLQHLAARNPFGQRRHTRQEYLTVTFMKNPTAVVAQPQQGRDFAVLGVFEGALCCVSDLSGKPPNVMGWIEKQLGDRVTTRTWLTVQRILKRMER